MRGSIAITAALLLTACGSDGGESEKSEAGEAGKAEAAAAAAGGGAVTMQAGEWETRIEVVRMEAPNMPQGVNMPMPAATTVRTCLTPEQVSRPNADFFTGSGESGGCTYENFSMAGGRIQGIVQCSNAGTTMRSTFNGQFSATSYEMTQQVETSAQGMAMEMESRTSGRRIGDCPAG